MFKNKKGFTLIEMMVVIGVIGILAALVLTAVGPSRNKARDARIISSVNQTRAIIETMYNPTDQIYNIDDANASLVAAQTDVTNNGGNLTWEGGGTNVYRVWSPLNLGGYFCANSDAATFQGAAANPSGNVPDCQ
ncbi:MAG: type II secretion system protein [Patescibacteria group bacterium]|nr:type II secretion system protein [Patescibacteria group bacterium]